jgi:oligoendopeptidase F
MFGNLVGTLNDISTMIHESGHAIHGQMMHDSLPLNTFSDTPSEIAEIGSMALELLSMDHW